jgi:hypothetical protein
MTESDLAGLNRESRILWAVRAAQRVLPLVAQAEPAYGQEVWEWTAAIDDALAAAPSSSPFVLRVASQLPRTVADAASLASRRIGPSPYTEPLELACAAAAYALDCASATEARRSVSLAWQAAAMARATHYPIVRLLEQDYRELLAGIPPTELWYSGSPEGWEVWEAAWEERRRRLPRFLQGSSAIS